MDTNTIFHETGHTLHYFLTYNKVPNNFNEIIELAKQNEGLFSKIEIFDLYFREIEQKELKKLKETSNENIKNYFLKLKKEIENIMNSTRENVIASYINLGIPKEHVEKLFNGIINTEKYIECLKNIYYEEIVDSKIKNTYPEYTIICDILDAIYGGKLFNGIMKNTLTNKKINFDGHGINYYSDEEKVFDEIIANFSVLLKLGKTEILKEIVGENIYNMISDFYYKYILGIKNEKRKGTRR